MVVKIRSTRRGDVNYDGEFTQLYGHLRSDCPDWHWKRRFDSSIGSFILIHKEMPQGKNE